MWISEFGSGRKRGSQKAVQASKNFEPHYFLLFLAPNEPNKEANKSGLTWKSNKMTWHQTNMGKSPYCFHMLAAFLGVSLIHPVVPAWVGVTSPSFHPHVIVPCCVAVRFKEFCVIGVVRFWKLIQYFLFSSVLFFSWGGGRKGGIKSITDMEDEVYGFRRRNRARRRENERYEMEMHGGDVGKAKMGLSLAGWGRRKKTYSTWLAGWGGKSWVTIKHLTIFRNEK